MIRTIILILAGAVVGVVVAALYATPQFGEGALLTTVGRSDAGSSAYDARGAAPMVAAEAFLTSAAAFEAVADELDSEALESAIERVRAEAPSLRRDKELNALLAQLTGLDPRRAVALAQRLNLGRDVLSELFKHLTLAEPEAALDELRALSPPSAQREVALALLDVLGNDAAGIARIGSSLPPAEARSFHADAIGKLAERDMLAALAASFSSALPDEAQSVAQQRIAVVMARIDPVAAFEQARTITTPKFRVRFLNSLVDEWAKWDPESALAYLETADLPEISLGEPAFRALAVSGPERLLLVAEKFSPRTRTNAQEAALAELAALDPVTAFNRVSSLPGTGDVARLINEIADRYAVQDPNAALAWATSLVPHSPVAWNAVLTRIAATDPLRATEVVIGEILDPVAANRAAMPSLTSVLSESLRIADPGLAQIADMLARHEDPRVTRQLDGLVVGWSEVDPEGALGWALDSARSLKPSIASAVAQRFGSLEPALARQSIQRLPRELRGAWLSGAASGMAQADLSGTLSWIEGFRDDPAYGIALLNALRGGARNDPETVARVLDDNPQQRVALADDLAGEWYASDPLAAERWVLNLPRGAEQDRAIVTLLQASATHGEIDGRLFSSLSSDDAREQAVLSSLLVLGRTNPALGQQLIDAYVRTPELREDAQRRIEASSSLPAGIIQLIR